MIVSDDTVSKALAYLAADPHPIALARKDVADCENKCKQIWSVAYLAADGPVESRKCVAECNESYREARAEEAEAIKEYERHRARVKAADMIVEVWRSEQANIRAAEKIR